MLHYRQQCFAGCGHMIVIAVHKRRTMSSSGVVARLRAADAGGVSLGNCSSSPSSSWSSLDAWAGQKLSTAFRCLCNRKTWLFNTSLSCQGCRAGILRLEVSKVLSDAVDQGQ